VFSTVYFRFRNYRNTDVVFVSENTVPLFVSDEKNMKVKVVESFADRFRPFSSLTATVFLHRPLPVLPETAGEKRKRKQKQIKMTLKIICSRIPSNVQHRDPS